MHPPDLALVVGGDAATEQIYRAHADWMRSYALRLLGSSADADDAVHEVFRRLLGPRPSTGSISRSYLAVAIRNECRTILRRRQREYEAAVAFLEESAATHQCHTAAAFDADPHAILQRVLAGLPGRCRAVVGLRARGMSYVVIARKLKISPNTVHAQLQRAKARLTRSQ